LTPADGRPKYWLIAMTLRGAIDSGEYPPGARLPGENDVMRDHGVARATARQALAQLGGSTWPSGISVWDAETESRDLVVDQLEVSQTELPGHVGLLLGLPEGAEAVLRSRRYVLDGKPVLLSRSWLPAQVAAGTPIAQPNPGPGGVYARLAEAGRAPARFREDLRSRMPQPEEAERLAIAPGTPVVDICRVALAADGTPVEVNEMTADSSAYIFRYEFDRP
jgi:GntR family transcriptional regulator